MGHGKWYFVSDLNMMNDMKNTWVSLVVVAVLFGGGGFYAGMQYGKGQSGSSPTANSGSQQNGAGPGGGGGRGNRGGNRLGDFTSGDIIAKDDKSITVKLRDGGSKIVFYSASTEISKFVSGAGADLAIGTSVTVRGATNSDGSLTAQQIQIRPAGQNVPGQNRPGQSNPPGQ